MSDLACVRSEYLFAESEMPLLPTDGRSVRRAYDKIGTALTFTSWWNGRLGWVELRREAANAYSGRSLVGTAQKHVTAEWHLVLSGLYTAGTM